jgi:hypothetical protein
MYEDEIVEFAKIHVLLCQWHGVFSDTPRLVYATAVGVVDALAISSVMLFWIRKLVPTVDFTLYDQFPVGYFMVVGGYCPKIILA